MTKVTKFSRLTSKFYPKGVVSPKDIFLKLATNEWSDETFLLTSKFVSWGLSAPAPGLYTCIKSWKKNCIETSKRFFFKTCSKWPKWQEVSFDINIMSPGVVCPWPVAIYFQMMTLGWSWPFLWQGQICPWCFWVTAYRATSALVFPRLIQHIHSTQASDIGPMVLWFKLIEQRVLLYFQV